MINSENKNLDLNISILEPVKNQIWIAAKNGLWVWKEEKNKLQLHPLNENVNWNLNTAYLLENNKVLLADKAGRIFIINPESNKISEMQKLPFNESVIGFRFFEENLFLYSSKRIYIQKKNNSGYQEIFNIKESHINHLTIDATTGILWIATTKGLVKLSPINKGIQLLPIPSQNDENGIVISIVETHNSLLVLTQSGFIWKLQDAIWEIIHKPQEDTTVYALDRVENKIILSTSSGLMEWGEDKFHKINLKNLHIKSSIRKVIFTPQKELWILFSNQEIKRYQWPGLQEITKEFRNQPNFWRDNKWNDIKVDNNNRIWMVGWMPKGFGITIFDPVKQLFRDVSEPSFQNSKNDFVGDYYHRIGDGKDNTLLFSAFGGWNRIDEDGKILKKIDILKYPIADSHISGISEDLNGNVFFATAEGLHIYLSQKDRVVRISQIDGLPTDYLIHSYEILKDNRIAIGISNGIITIDPVKILETRLKNRLELTQIKINSKIQPALENHIELSKEETDLTLHFSDLSYSENQNVKYRYRFIGENYWHDLGNTPELALNHITPGKYEIEVEVADHLANVQQKTLMLFVTAHPPFQKSTTFYILLLLIAIAIIISIHRYLLQRQRKEQLYIRRIKDAEMQTLRAQMNPHFMFNTLNSINSYIIQNKTDDASNYLTTFSRLMRNILQNSKHTFISLENEIQTLKLYLELESARLEHSFDYQIIVDKETDSLEILIPPLIIQPFAENAIWHGLRNMTKKGNLKIHIHRTHPDHLQISIEDNGIGRKKSMLLKKEQTNHKSYGMDITTERLKTLHPDNKIEVKDLYNNESMALGTQVILTIKLSEND
ncbi:MAG: histidine kinase [Flavobacteriales bacterium]|nr:histidine kinase [Flavobacteriales bacterium]